MHITRAKVGRNQVEIFVGERKTKLGEEESVVITIEDIEGWLKANEDILENNVVLEMAGHRLAFWCYVGYFSESQIYNKLRHVAKTKLNRKLRKLIWIRKSGTSHSNVLYTDAPTIGAKEVPLDEG